VSALKTLAGKLLLVSLAIENWLVLVVGLAGAMMWLSGKAVEGGFSEPWKAFLASWLTFSRRVTLTFLLLGGAAWFFHRVRSRVLHRPGDEAGDGSQAWFFLVTGILAVHGVLAAIVSHPLLLLFQENIRLLQSWGVWEGLRRGGEFSGIYLVPVFAILLAPCLAALTALAFVVGAVTPLGHFFGLEKFPGVLLRSICLQIAFLLGLFFTQGLFEAGIRVAVEGLSRPDDLELKEQVLPWLVGQKAVFAPMTQRLAWLLPGFFICAAIVLRKAREGEWRDYERPSQFPEKITTAESAPIELAGGFLETDERFKHTSYLMKWKFISNPFYKVFEVYDSGNQLVFVARMNGLSLLTRVIRVYGMGQGQGETLSIIGRRFFRFPNLFELTYCPTNRKVGTFKNSRTGWIILDELGRQIAAMKMEEGSLGSARCQIVSGRLPVCKYTFQNILRPILMIDFPEDSATGFDRKLGIGLALVLCFQSVAFNYSYDNYS